jgi:hypothetical protein
MPMPAVNGGTRVRRVWLRTAAPNPAALRQRAQRVLGGLTLRPPGLPPAAVLVVRRLADPRPGTLALTGGVPVLWEHAVDGALAALARAAPRPADGPVAGDAEAVLFTDTAELLACAARDALRGDLGVRWWWAALGMADAVALARAWVDAPAEVPAALALLGPSAPGFIASLPVETVCELLARVVAWHPAPPRAREPDRDRGTATPEAADLLGFAAAAPVLEPVARQRARTLGDVPAAPVRDTVRAAVPQPRGQAAGRPAAAPRIAPARGAGAPPIVGGQGGVTRRAAGPPASPDRAAEAVFSPQVPTGRAPHMAVPRPLAPAGPGPPAAVQPAAPDPVRGAAPEPDRGRPAQPVEPLGAGGLQPAAPRAASSSRRCAERARGAPTRTRLGGLFYLLDVALALELYGDFTTPLEPGIALDPWDFVALLGAHLLEAPLPADPVWPLLAGLASHPRDAFDPPREWRVPESWLAQFEPVPLVVRRTAGRLVHWHPDGFPVVDVALGPDLCRDPLDRWIAWIGAYLRARIGRELCARMLVQRAQVFVTPTRVDVALSLAELPIEVRLAGLDRSPGWIPAARRHVELHFE